MKAPPDGVSRANKIPGVGRRCLEFNNHVSLLVIT